MTGVYYLPAEWSLHLSSSYCGFTWFLQPCDHECQVSEWTGPQVHQSACCTEMEQDLTLVTQVYPSGVHTQESLQSSLFPIHLKAFCSQ